MQLINATKMEAGYTLGLDPDGRESLVVVVKGTYTIPTVGKPAALAAEQAPLVTADVFTGEPGFSAALYETDFAPKKPRCDILLNGSAHAPKGEPAERVRVTVQMGGWSKSIDVVGNRVWKTGFLSCGASKPEPFAVMPISYNTAFGGVDRIDPDEMKHRYFLTNHAGVGYSTHPTAKELDGKPLPNSEEPGKSVSRPNAEYRPMAFGPVGRAWQPRAFFAGTYDQNWIDNVFPFLPADFKEDYFQAAAADQQVPHPTGGEEIVLTNLTKSGKASFRLPERPMPVVFIMKDYSKKETTAVIDTVLIEPDLGRFMVSWRSSLPLKRNIFEVNSVVVGRKSRGWWKARELGRDYYPSMREWIKSKT